MSSRNREWSIIPAVVLPTKSGASIVAVAVCLGSILGGGTPLYWKEYGFQAIDSEIGSNNHRPV